MPAKVQGRPVPRRRGPRPGSSLQARRQAAADRHVVRGLPGQELVVVGRHRPVADLELLGRPAQGRLRSAPRPRRRRPRPRLMTPVMPDGSAPERCRPEGDDLAGGRRSQPRPRRRSGSWTPGSLLPAGGIEPPPVPGLRVEVAEADLAGHRVDPVDLARPWREVVDRCPGLSRPAVCRARPGRSRSPYGASRPGRRNSGRLRSSNTWNACARAVAQHLGRADGERGARRARR